MRKSEISGDDCAAKKELDWTCFARRRTVTRSDGGYKMVDKRPRGRPRIGMLEELKEGSFEKMKRRE